jgi:hypothetical protein
MVLTESKTPPKVGVRPKHSASVWFAYGDASGKGFGVSLWVAGTDGIDVCYGTWDQEVRGQSSNYREFLNLVLRIEKLLYKVAWTDARALKYLGHLERVLTTLSRLPHCAK